MRRHAQTPRGNNAAHIDLDDLRTRLEVAVAEMPVDELAALIGIVAGTQAQAWARLTSAAPAPTPKLVDAKEMAAILDVPENWVRDKARASALPCQQLGHYVRFNPIEVLEAVRRMRALHDSAFRGLKKAKETRVGGRRVSNGCPSSAAEAVPEARRG